jgi:hypothetical protein
MQLPDVKERATKKLALREFFQLKLISKGLAQDMDINSISNAYNHAKIIASIIAHTYTMGYNAAEHMRQNFADLDIIKGWQVIASDDDQTCLYCKRTANKIYPKDKYPIVPKHIGCRCMVMPKLVDHL